MLPRLPRSYAPTAEEAAAWADTLVRRRLLHAAIRVPTGQWLVQKTCGAPVHVLDGPAALLDLAADIQHRTRTRRNRIR
ncbi:hypothetical protein [Streptomyces niveus]|uniref:Uncharacterized protein n=1 Tax=Streptomyces niveus TaxID=193462 RepID=A0A1U9R2X8_STRNV|nr:hypothetical protein [Streptomyces niveus]AQU70245.1 hypothetical protein BBN63_32760 [Streptomyces niveus]